MLPRTKNEKVRSFKSEEAFYRYLNSLINKKGYVLVETSPLKKRQSLLSLQKTIFSESREG